MAESKAAVIADETMDAGTVSALYTTFRPNTIDVFRHRRDTTLCMIVKRTHAHTTQHTRSTSVSVRVPGVCP